MKSKLIETELLLSQNCKQKEYHPYSSIYEPYSSFTYLSSKIILLPVVVYYFIISFFYGRPALFSIVNPEFPESKTDILNSISSQHEDFIAAYCRYARDGKSNEDEVENILGILHKAKLKFPLVAKPDIGLKGLLVELLNDKQDLINYLLKIADDAILHFQQFIDIPGEVGIFYIRHPSSTKGRILSHLH